MARWALVGGYEEMGGGPVLLPAGAGAPAAARRHLSAVGGPWGSRVLDLALLLTTELVTNAVHHVGGSVVLRVEQRPDAVGIHVTDEGSVLLAEALTSAPVMPGQTAVGGRGLPLVEALARRWGSRLDVLDGRVRHVVWFELAVGAAATVAAAGSPPA